MAATAKTTVASLSADVAALTALVQTLAAAVLHTPTVAEPTPAAPSQTTTMPREQRLAVQQAARIEGQSAYHTAFATLARERGGVNAKNGAAIRAEAEEAGRHAAEAVYMAAGYVRCPTTQCNRLVTPGYAVCPNCA